MKTYPITVPRQSYRGSNLAKLRKITEYNRVAALVENYINNDLSAKQNSTIQQYISELVAIEIGENGKIVREVIFSIDSGSNGVTVLKGCLESAISAQ